MPEQIRLALPSKGRMEEETLDFLAGCGLRVTKTNPRQYVASLPTLPDVLVLFQRARDIPVSVAAGDVDLGITGYDALAETVGPAPDGVIVIHDALGYGECALVLAVPEDWEDVQSVSDLARRAAERPLRVATKYETSVTRFLADSGVENVRVVVADGALESAPTVGYADFIADITSTGTTLRENRPAAARGGHPPHVAGDFDRQPRGARVAARRVGGHPQNVGVHRGAPARARPVHDLRQHARRIGGRSGRVRLQPARPGRPAGADHRADDHPPGGRAVVGDQHRHPRP